MIEDILVLEEQDSNPSLVVVAVSGEEPTRSEVVVCGWTLGSACIQELVTLKARVLLVAGEGVLENAWEQIDLETWSFSIKQLLFSSSQISTYTLTLRDILSDSLVTAVCHKAELSLETGQVRLEMLHT